MNKINTYARKTFTKKVHRQRQNHACTESTIERRIFMPGVNKLLLVIAGLLWFEINRLEFIVCFVMNNCNALE